MTEHEKIIIDLMDWLDDEIEDDTAKEHPNSFYAGIIEGLREARTKLDALIRGQDYPE